MTRRDFALIARVVAQLPHDDADHPSETTRATAAQLFANELVQINPRFDRSRFLRACGV